MNDRDFRIITIRIISFSDLESFMWNHHWCSPSDHVTEVIMDTFFDYGEDLDQKADDAFLFDLATQIFNDCKCAIWKESNGNINDVNGIIYIMHQLLGLTETITKHIWLR